MSARKPMNDKAGYVASRSGAGGWAVVYLAEAQGIDVDGRKYAVVCETHGTISGADSLKDARVLIKSVEFCEACMEKKDEIPVPSLKTDGGRDDAGPGDGAVKETEGEPIRIAAHKRFPSGALLTKCDLDGQVFYVRENTAEGQQVLELLAPEPVWLRISAIVKVEDSLKREVRRNEAFTAEWAEGWLSDARPPEPIRPG